MHKTGYINKLLFDKRVAKGYDYRTASKLLGISSFKLKLIEYGYISVNKKYHQRFIDLYQLPQDFFITNSKLATALEKEETTIFNDKTKNFYKKKWVRWTGVALTAGSLGGVGYGVYSLEKINITPRGTWTNEFTTFHNGMIEKGTRSWSAFYLDNVYHIEENYIEPTVGPISTRINSYEKDVNASDTNFQAKVTYQGQVQQQYPHLVNGALVDFDFLVYNRRKLLYSSYSNPNKPNDISITRALISISDEHNYILLPFQYKDVDGTYKWAEYDTPFYKEWRDTFSYVASHCFSNLSGILTAHDLGYKDARNLVNDLQVISRDLIYHNRVGVIVTSLFTVLAVVFLIITSIAFFFNIRSRKKVIDGPVVLNSSKPIVYNNRQQMWLGKKIKDIKFSTFIPDFVLEIIGLIFLLVSSISIYVFFTRFLGSQRYEQIAQFRIVGANLLQAGVTLLFFMKFDTMKRKNNESIVFTITIMFLLGIALYVAELCVFKVIDNTSSLLNIILNVFNSLLPGNMFFTLGWFTLLYFLLFKSPTAVSKKKVSKTVFRSLSAIPTFFLIFGLLWQYWLKNISFNSYYVNLLFATKGILLTTLIIVYLYGLFIYQQVAKKKYGKLLAEERYFYSNKYNIIKNSIAVGTLIVILIVDAIVGKTVPNNVLGMGNAWPIAIILPLIMFYYPHHGKRSKTWSITLSVLNALFFFGGYAAIAMRLLSYLNVGEFIFIVS